MTVTGEEAAALMLGGSGGSETLPEIVELEKPTLVEYQDVDDYTGKIIEHYKVGTEEEYSLRVDLSFQNKGTPNEQISNLRLYDKDGQAVNNISFSGFYIG